MKKRFIVIIIFLLMVVCVYVQLMVSFLLDNGSGYLVIEGVGFGIELFDCEYISFGVYIIQLYDVILDCNVFVFYSYIDVDNDCCFNFDCVCMEIKGGFNMDVEVQYEQGEIFYY